jgi:hypothetical protein
MPSWVVRASKVARWLAATSNCMRIFVTGPSLRVAAAIL